MGLKMAVTEIILSSALVEEIYQHLIKEPYVSVAPLIAKLQAEAAPQFAASAPSSSVAEESVKEDGGTT